MKIITLINVCKLISGVSYFNKNVLREKNPCPLYA